jgi:DNA polymerase-3 subunit alpha
LKTTSLQLKKKQLIPLHVHTAKGSVGDSILKIKDYVKKAKEYGLSHIAITNHGSMADMYDFYYSCIEEDITPIIGCEIYETIDRESKVKAKEGESAYWHTVLLAKNQKGLENLLYIVTDANLKGFYYKPRTDISIMKEHGEGIIALSACLGGKIPKILKDITEEELLEIESAYIDESIVGNLKDSEVKTSNETFNKAIEAVEEYKSIFDEFYLELQPGDFDEQIKLNKALVLLSKITSTKLVVTNDVHYLNQKDWRAHDIHVKISRKQKVEDKRVYPDTCYYFQNYSSIKNSFPYLNKEVVENAIKNTITIAESCNISFNSQHLHMPTFSVPDGHSEESWLTKLCFEKLEEIKCILKDPAEYVSRLMYELSVIDELGFSGYFLTVRDFVDYAKKSGIPVGPGRGSVCGSLVAFMTGITAVDPIKYKLLFERFLSIHRKGSIPDVDLDFSSDKREQMFNYAVEKHGIDKCALVSTFGMRKAKASLRDTARVFEIDAEVADEAAKLIPQVFYDDEGEKTTDLSIEESMEVVPRLKEMSLEYPEWFEMSILLEDLPRSTSIHAAGTLVAPVNLFSHIPLRSPKNEGINATSLNLSDAERAGFVKFDFLSLATLSVIDNTQRDVDHYFDFVSDEYDDESVWDLIGSKNITTLFQISSRTYKERMHRLKPRNIEELAACLALVRGPCISSKQDQLYMEIIEGTKEIELIHPFYDDVTKKTNGILLYQEQLMEIAVNFGFTLEESFNLMKVVAKKKMKEIKSFESMLYILAEKKNVPLEAVDKVWRIMLDAGLYCFNKSHAIAYALLCYQSAYLKFYFPREYMKNSLTNAYLRKEEMKETVQESRRMGLRFLPLDAHKSNWEFTLEEEFIRIGMCSIKSFGEAACEEITLKRPFENFNDFNEKIEKSKCSKRAIVPAIFVGLFSCFEEDRVAVYTEYMDIRKEEVLDEIKLQGGSKFNLTDPYDKIEELLLDIPLISNPINDIEPIGFNDMKKNTIFTTTAIIRKVKKHKDKNKNIMAFLELETADGYINCTMFSESYKTYKSFCKKDLICILKGKKDGEESCIVMSLE